MSISTLHYSTNLSLHLSPPSTATVTSSPDPQSLPSVSPVSVSTTPPGECFGLCTLTICHRKSLYEYRKQTGSSVHVFTLSILHVQVRTHTLEVRIGNNRKTDFLFYDCSHHRLTRTCTVCTRSIDGVKHGHSIPSVSRIYIAFFLCVNPTLSEPLCVLIW